MNRRVVVLVALLGVSVSLACQDILKIGPVPAATDDGGTDDGATEASITKCDPYAPLGAATQVPGLPSGSNVTNVTLSPDELTAYVSELQSSDLAAPQALIQYQRGSVSSPFGGQTTLAAGPFAVRTTLDNRTAVWNVIEGQDQSVAQNMRMYMAQRPNASTPFSFDAGTRLFHLDGGFELEPVIRGDGQEIFFDEIQKTVNAYRSLADSGFQSAAVESSIVGQPYALSPDGLVLYEQAPGSIQVVTRSSPDAAFGNNRQNVVLPDAGSPGWSYFPVAVSVDYCTVYLFENMDTQELDGAVNVSGALFVTHKQP